MKYLLIALLLSGCADYDGAKRPQYPKYHFGDSVQVYGGFYKGTVGNIYSVYTCVAPAAPDKYGDSWCYVLEVKKPKQMMRTKTIAEVSEQELTK